jgi:hypothetical protein
MKKMEKFTDIGQFRNVIKSIVNRAQYVGQDENDEPIYDHSVGKPKVVFTGTVKLHGTNLGVCYNANDGLWVQSRSNKITPEKDNAGSAFAVMNNERNWQKLINDVITKESIDASENNVCIYGEWCGGNIQKGVAISGLDKMACIFAVKISPHDEEQESYYVSSSGLSDNEVNIFNIEQFGKYEIEIDFERPDKAQNTMVQMVQEVEDECPCGKFFGRIKGEDNTCGEGIVFATMFKGHRYIYKAKGQKHSISKTKTIAEVDVAKLDSIMEFVEYAVTTNRLNQGIEVVFTANNLEVDIKHTGSYLKWLVGDITKEESDVMDENGLEPKDVNKHVSYKGRQWFMNYINSGLGIK